MANDSLDRFNTGRIFVQSPNADYLVPEFLLDRLDSTDSAKDFNASYTAAKAEVPFWWTQDVEIPLTKKEHKKIAREMAEKKQELNKQRAVLEAANASILSKLSEQEQEYSKKVEYLEHQIDERTAQLQLYNHNIQLKYQKSLLEMEYKIQSERKEKELLELEKEKLSKMSEEEIKADILDSDTRRVLGDVNKELDSLRAQNDSLRKELVQRYANFGVSYIPPTPSSGNGGDVKAKQYIIESFSEGNILECKALTLFNREKSLNELENISFNVKKTGKTVVFAPAIVIEGVMMAIMRAFPSSISQAAGVIRIEGVGEDILPENYRKALSKKVMSSSYVADDFSRMNKPFNKLFKGRLTAEAESLIAMMQVPKEQLNKKLNKLDEVTIMKLAVVFVLLKKMPLSIIDSIEDEFGREDLSAFYQTINSYKSDSAVLLLTSSKQTAAAVMDIRLYSLMLK